MGYIGEEEEEIIILEPLPEEAPANLPVPAAEPVPA